MVARKVHILAATRVVNFIVMVILEIHCINLLYVCTSSGAF
jgi:hypothetical protein